MTAEIGLAALWLAAALAVLQMVSGAIALRTADGEANPLAIHARPAAVVQAFLAVLAFAILLHAFATTDLSLKLVASNSHSMKPLVYKLTGTWGNHEGSMLLWVAVLALSGGLLAGFEKRLPERTMGATLAVQGFVALGFYAFLLLASNPFERLPVPAVEGTGLNPLLQDIGLAIHPPTLYAGYVGLSVAFSLAMGALLTREVNPSFARVMRPWVLGAWVLLTLGITAGSYWAYYELGWGGWWFWDPVENASLMPWLAATALMHSVSVLAARDALRTWTIMLGVLAFSMSMLGTFLVRSGVLNSVHSFASDPARGIFILCLLGIYVAGAFALFAWRAPAMAPAGIFAPISREGGIVLNNLLLCSITAVVLVGTLYPLFLDLLTGQMISVGPPFFNAATAPLALPLVMAMAVGPMLAWKRASLWPVLQRLWWVACVALLAFILTLTLAGWHVLSALGFACAFWLLAGAVADIADRAGVGRTSLRNALNRARHLPRAAWGAAIAHAGVGVTILGISGMGLATEKLVAVPPGGSTSFAGYEWRLEGVRDFIGPNFTARKATITVLREGRVVHVMEPSKRFFPTGRMTTTEAAIRTSPAGDLYAVLGEERDGEAVLRLHDNPLAPWIWIGAGVMALGAALSLSDRRIRIAAPARRRREAEVSA